MKAILGISSLKLRLIIATADGENKVKVFTWSLDQHHT